MPDFIGEKDFRHDALPGVGVLLTNLGTPEAPTAAALRPYLREFLSDPRVVEVPRWKWRIILNCFILPFRPKRSAEAYRKVWTEEGSPLLVISKRQRDAVARRLAEKVGNPLHVALGMRYGEPSIEGAIEELVQKGCRKILHLPLYPQYSGSTVGSNFDAVTDALQKRRWMPELRCVNQYEDAPEYIAALAASVRELWEKDGEAERLLMSFHGIPERYFRSGDPYHCLCHKTGRLLAEALGLEEGRWQVTFQSRFGREPWIRPYTDETLKAWGAESLASVDVICPGFSADCLETLEEIEEENRDYFLEAGGGRFRYVPALNDRDDHIEALCAVALHHLAGWVSEPGTWDEAAERERLAATQRRAEAMKARDEAAGQA